jgi:5-methylcytosine-specific restriction endonuclease McrA
VDGVIELRPGVAYCFRQFYPLIGDLVRGAWVRYVRQQNLEVLGEATDLSEFLFGSERAALAVLRPILMPLQEGHCFYCPTKLTAVNVHVDHFIPWSRYPVDLGHNFVLADSKCNTQKRDRLPACNHLERWMDRNLRHDAHLTASLRDCGIVADLAASNRVAHWAYSQTAAVGGLTWKTGNEMVLLGAEWQGLLHG